MTSWIESLERRALLSGELDPTFGTNGVTTTNFDAASERFTRVISGPGGKVYAAGFLDGGYLVARFTANGQADTTFNGTGFLRVPVDTGYAASGLAVSPEGEIYVGGTRAVLNSSQTRACVVAITPAGTLDPAFDIDGVWNGLWNGRGSNSLVGLDYFQGRIYAGGSDDQAFAMVRLMTDGSLDAAFDGDGKALFAPGQTPVAKDFVLSTPTNSTPQFLIGGDVTAGAVVVRFNLDGTRDTGFATTPFNPVRYSAPQPLFDVARLATDSVGRVWVGGSEAGHATITRLTTDGHTDGSFNSIAAYISQIPSETTVTGLAVVADDALVYTAPAGGTAGDRVVSLYVPTYDYAQTNKSFAVNGTLVGLTTQVADIARQPDGKLILAGRQLLADDNVDTQLVRLNAPSPVTNLNGFVFDDVNGNGANDDNTNGVSGGTVYLDLNGDGVQRGEPVATVSAGRFKFTNVAPGTYQVALSFSSLDHFRQTFPVGNGTLTVTTTGPSNIAGSFGAQRLSTVFGTAFDDTNDNGVQDGNETGSVGRTIYVDADNDGQFDGGETRTLSLSDGRFSFDLPPGTVKVRQVLTDGYHETSHTLTGGPPDATFGIDYTLRLPNDAGGSLLFGSRPADLPLVHGTLINDANGNGVVDVGEGLAGSNDVIYADANNDGRYGPGEPWTVTRNGTWAFGLAPGSYVIRQQLAAGTLATIPAGDGGLAVTVVAGVADADAGVLGRYTVPPSNGVTGYVFVDQNRNGHRDGGEGLADLDRATVFVDTNKNGILDDGDAYRTTIDSEGRYNFYLPADGRTYRLRLQNDVTRRPFTTAAYVDVTSTPGGTTPAGPDFGVAPYIHFADTTGYVFSDNNQNGTFDLYEPYLAGVTVYLDRDNDHVFDADELSTVTDQHGGYGFSNPPDTGPATRVRVVVPAGSRQTSPTNGYGFQPQAYPTTGNGFGLYAPPTARLSGFVFDDANQNGLYDNNETKTANVIVFFDNDADGVLDSNEKRVTTGTDGIWSFGNLAAGNFRVRCVFKPGATATTPPIYVALAPGQVLGGLSIGSKGTAVTPPANTAKLSGFTFNDVNKNGLFDAGDSVAAGKTVWLDLDDDGVKDAGEASVVTDSAGKFAFAGLAARTYHVRRVFPSGYRESTPARYVTLAGGQAATDVRIGSRT